MPFIEEQSETGVPSEEFVELLSTVTREMVDAEATRCPDKEMSKKMTQVRNPDENKSHEKLTVKMRAALAMIRCVVNQRTDCTMNCFSCRSSVSLKPRRPTTLSEELSHVLSAMCPLVWVSLASTSWRPSWLTACCRSPPPKLLKSDQDSEARKSLDTCTMMLGFKRLAVRDRRSWVPRLTSLAVFR